MFQPAPTACVVAALCFPGDTKSSHSNQLQSELSALQSAVSALPDDPHTRPGDGIGIYSPGFRRLGQIQVLVRGDFWKFRVTGLTSLRLVLNHSSFGIVCLPRLLQLPPRVEL